MLKLGRRGNDPAAPAATKSVSGAHKAVIWREGFVGLLYPPLDAPAA
jgi:hypothetical protein